LVDAILLAWAVIATHYALTFHKEIFKAKMVMEKILGDADVRERMVAEYDGWKKTQMQGWFKKD
jgi:hypothetical protein